MIKPVIVKNCLLHTAVFALYPSWRMCARRGVCVCVCCESVSTHVLTGGVCLHMQKQTSLHTNRCAFTSNYLVAKLRTSPESCSPSRELLTNLPDLEPDTTL